MIMHLESMKYVCDFRGRKFHGKTHGQFHWHVKTRKAKHIQVYARRVKSISIQTECQDMQKHIIKALQNTNVKNVINIIIHIKITNNLETQILQKYKKTADSVLLSLLMRSNSIGIVTFILNFGRNKIIKNRQMQIK